jgi:hypothetical protein
MREFIKIIENVLHSYERASEDQLRQIARIEGGAANGTLTPEDCSWNYDPAFPLERLVACMPNGEWAEWYKEETQMDIEDGLSRGWEEMAHEDIQEPIVIAVNSAGEVDIWDGWHRTAGQMVRGAKTIPAIVGTQIKRDLIVA